MSLLKIFIHVLILSAPVLAKVEHQVTVGRGALLFNPETTIAQPGDTITFQFFPKSSFEEPCRPLSNGIFSGFVAARDIEKAAATTFTVEVKDEEPLWFYCGQTVGNHCQSGMLYSVNPPISGEKTFQVFKERAKSATIPSLSPPEPKPVGGRRRTSIEVGPGGTLQFVPANVSSLVGEVLTFNFNPKNHSVTQSSFENPCQPLEGAGFSSGFVPTQISPSGATFELVVKDTKPLWFCCAQVNGKHCQNGMVGSVNAPVSGDKTFDAFVTLARTAPSSKINAHNPIGGTLLVNGTLITTNDGNGFQSGGSTGVNIHPPIQDVPAPGKAIPEEVAGRAGGKAPDKYNWPSQLTDRGWKLLQLLNWVDNVLVDVLTSGHVNLTTGRWADLYPPTVVNTVGSMGAQALVHRSTATDSLLHYNKEVVGTCKYQYPIANVGDFTRVVVSLMLLEIGLLLDILAETAATDPWLVIPLAAALGSKARMAGMIDMMQNHIPSATPREAMLPADLVYSYVSTHWVVQDSCPQKLPFQQWPVLNIVKTNAQDDGRIKTVEFSYDDIGKGEYWMAWIGAWGTVWYNKVWTIAENVGSVDVSNEVSGHVWVVLTNAAGADLAGLKTVMVAGPELIWVTPGMV